MEKYEKEVLKKTMESRLEDLEKNWENDDFYCFVDSFEEHAFTAKYEVEATMTKRYFLTVTRGEKQSQEIFRKDVTSLVEDSSNQYECRDISLKYVLDNIDEKNLAGGDAIEKAIGMIPQYFIDVADDCGFSFQAEEIVSKKEYYGY